MTDFPKGTIADTSNPQPGEIINTDFALYNITSICGFKYMLTDVCAKTQVTWI